MPHRRKPASAKTPPESPPGGFTTPRNSRQPFTTGNRGITPRNLVKARDVGIAANVPAADALALRLSTGEITVQAWTSGMRELIKQTYTQQYMLSRGGVNAMTQADWGQLGAALRDQYRHLDQFAQEIASGKLSPAQIQARARLYVNSATQAFERGKASSHGLRLPAYPGDGSTQCRTNCKCRWSIADRGAFWECRWMLGVAEHCPDCVTYAGRWNPLVFPKV